jgi:HPt (histidine-containing phosphotransfer) domain-containing protein
LSLSLTPPGGGINVKSEPGDATKILLRLFMPISETEPATAGALAAPDSAVKRPNARSVELAGLYKIAATPTERAEILLDFMTHTRSELTALTAALIIPSLPVCVRIAHRMKGSSRMVGAEDLATACEGMERAARRGSVYDAAAAKPLINCALERLEAHVAASAG